MARGNSEAFDAMVRYVNDPERNVRITIMAELSRHGKKGVPTLVKGLEDRDVIVRSVAAGSLGSFGPDAKQAVPILIRLLNDEDNIPRAAAADALAKIDPERFQHLQAERKID